MARPVKRRGFRTIVVESRSYNWRLNTRTRVIEVSLADSYAQRLEISFGWYDPWLYQPHESKPSVPEPEIATPRFVESAIRFALKAGWEPDARLPVLSVRFNEGAFSVVET